MNANQARRATQAYYDKQHLDIGVILIRISKAANRGAYCIVEDTDKISSQTENKLIEMGYEIDNDGLKTTISWPVSVSPPKDKGDYQLIKANSVIILKGPLNEFPVILAQVASGEYKFICINPSPYSHCAYNRLFDDVLSGNPHYCITVGELKQYLSRLDTQYTFVRVAKLKVVD